MSKPQPKSLKDILLPPAKPPAAMPKAVNQNQTERQINLRLNETAKKQLDVMAAEGDTTRQALIVEAINDFFRKCGKPPIA